MILHAKHDNFTNMYLFEEAKTLPISDVLCSIVSAPRDKAVDMRKVSDRQWDTFLPHVNLLKLAESEIIEIK